MRIGSNKERNTFVREQITNATLELLADKELRDISISEIILKAEVGRASFYRNYENKEDVLKEHIRALQAEWYRSEEYLNLSKIESRAEHDDALIASLFGHLKRHGEFHMLLYKRGLLYLLRDLYREVSGPKSEYPNLAAYATAFFFYGIYGWTEEWIARGMQESAEEMAELLRHRDELGSSTI